MARRTALATCCFCEAICGIALETEGRRITRLRGDARDPFSRGHVCPKVGREGGGASLTSFGEELVERFEEMGRVARRSVGAHLGALDRHLAGVRPARRRRERRADASG